ncbi:hypothetical protein FGG08_000773 [Glutinoglossum americanum]|uniref:Uncharacterized protein n=1 Tax=Glutinoglossum americanum TaxID=1670608 RepID=A0A9P8I3A6_9PEZI|nr:hypothetical protein FGG08_000773 [Glutinoglossum americanum]
MKLSRFALLATTAGSFAAAQPHRHQHLHRHVEKRNPEVEVVNVPGPTVTACVLSNGEPISQQDCEEGIENGSLVWANGVVSSAPAAAPTPPPAAPSSSQDVGAAFYEKPSSTAASAAPSSGSSSQDYSAGGTGLDSDFPDGKLDCSTFPSEYGPITIPWQGLGGWSGVQYVTFSSDGSSITHIDTGVSGMSCTEGAMCSYACPPGYQKSQWPVAQGSTGQSIGGIACKNGKLHLTNPDLSKKLCIPGVGNVQVQNSLGQNVAVCRTDYPDSGTESETIPTNTGPGQTVPLTNPDGNSYYQHQGLVTSAQYYLNPAGASPDTACTWGTAGSNLGNYAPMNLGVGKRDGATWIALFPNAPTNPDTSGLGYSVEITGDLSGSCKFEGGQFYTSTGTNPAGCTVQLMSGTATIKFY